MNKELETDAVKKMEAMEICLLLEEKKGWDLQELGST